MKTLLLRSILLSLFLLSLIQQDGSAQTVTITSANSVATNGITSGNIADGQQNVVLFGFTVAVSSGSVSFNQFNLNGSQGGLFVSGQLYKSTANNVTFASASPVVGASVVFSGNNPVISNINETITNTNYTYFLVATLNKSYGTVPGNVQFSFAQAIRPSPYTTYSPSFNGINFTLVNPTYSITGYNAAGNNITQGTIILPQTDVYLFGFSISANVPTTVKEFNLTSTTTQSFLASYFANGRLYRSSSSTFSISTATLVNPATVSFSTYQNTPGVSITGMSESIGTTAVYYFLVADMNVTSGVLPANVTMGFNTALSNGIVLSNSSNVAAPSTVTSKTFALSNPVVTLTSANAAGNNVNTGTIYAGQSGVVMFGFGVTVQGSSTISGFNMFNTYNQSTAAAYFNNGKIYRSTSSAFSLSTATQITTATVSFGTSSTGITVSGLSESFNNNASPVYYFIVGDFYSSYYGTVPATTQFSFTTSQTNSIVQSSPSSSNIAALSNITGQSYSLAASSFTVSGLNSAATNNITTTIYPGDIKQAFFGFKVTSNGTTNLTNINVDFPANNLTTYFTNAQLYLSSDDVYSAVQDALVSGALVSLTGNNNVSITLSQAIPNGTSQSFFLVMDVLPFNNGSTPTGTVAFRFNNNQGQTAFSQTSPYQAINNITVAGAALQMPANSLFVWVGGTGTASSTAANWSRNVAPTIISDAIIIPGGRPTYPVITAINSIGATTFTGNGGSINVNNYSFTPTGTLLVTQNATASFTGTGTVIPSSGAGFVLSANSTFSSSPAVTGSVLTNAGTLNLSSTTANSFSAASTNTGTINHTGTGALTFSNTLNNSGTFTKTGTGAVTFTGALTNTGIINQSAASGLMTITANFTNGGTVSQTAAGPITFSGTVTNNSALTLGAGAATFTGDVTNGSAGTFNLGSGGIKDLNGTNFTNNGALTMTGGTGNISAATFTNSSTGSLTPGAGLINFDLAGAQAINNNSSTAITFGKVGFITSGTKTLGGTGLFAINSTGVISMANTSGSTVFAAGASKLTLNSDLNGSAQVDVLPTNTSITGTVNVQRYIQGGSGYRGYRLLSSPVYDAQITTTGKVNNVYDLAFLKNTAYVTGTLPGTSANGMDNTVAANPTTYFYRESIAPNSSSFINGNFRGVNAINNATPYDIGVDGETGNQRISSGNGFMFFFRGNRASGTFAQQTVTTYVPTTATFTNSGTLNQGTIVVRNWSTPGSDNLLYTVLPTNASVRGLNLVGNPYASSIDWDKLGTGITQTNISSTIYRYNVKTKNYAVYIANTPGGVGTNFTGGTANIIPSGEGFFVKATAANPLLSFTENAKTSTLTPSSNLLLATTASAATPLQYMRLKLEKDSVNADDALFFFKSTAKTDFVQDEDAPYVRGSNTVALSSQSTDNIALAINRMALPTTKQIIPLNVTVSTTGIHQISLSEIKDIPKLYDVWLMDNYRKDSLDMRANTTYTFNTDVSNAATYGSSRFALIIRQNPAYALRLLDFKGDKVTGGAQLSWITENEGTYTNFTVERSTDNGKTFEIVGAFASTNIGKYDLLDPSPVTGLNQYRLKQDDLTGAVAYSKIVGLMYTKAAENIIVNNLSVYPNPTTDMVNVSVTPQVNASLYTIRITDGIGTVVKLATSTQPTWQDNVSNLKPGTYFVQVINTGTKAIVGSGKFIKN